MRISDWSSDVCSSDLSIKDDASLAQVWTHLAEKIHPLVLGQIFRTRIQIRTLARKLLNHQGIDEEKKDTIISFLCSDSGSHDHSINRREARDIGLIIETPSKEFYAILRSLYQSLTRTMELRLPFSPDTVLAGAAEANYCVRRALI